MPSLPWMVFGFWTCRCSDYPGVILDDKTIGNHQSRIKNDRKTLILEGNIRSLIKNDRKTYRAP